MWERVSAVVYRDAKAWQKPDQRASGLSSRIVTGVERLTVRRAVSKVVIPRPHVSSVLPMCRNALQCHVRVEEELHAHGVKPEWKSYGWTPAAQQQVTRILAFFVPGFRALDLGSPLLKTYDAVEETVPFPAVDFLGR